MADIDEHSATPEQGTKEILRIIVDSASTSKIIQNEVIIGMPDTSGSHSCSASSSSVDESMLLSLKQQAELCTENEAGVEVETNVRKADDESGEESDVSCNLGEDTALILDESSPTVSSGRDHSYFVQNEANERNKQAAIQKQNLRNQRYMQQKQSIPKITDNSQSKCERLRPAPISAAAAAASPGSVVKWESKSEGGVSEGKSAPVVEVNWPAVNMVMDNILSQTDTSNTTRPKEIHVLVGNSQSHASILNSPKANTAPTLLVHRAAAPVKVNKSEIVTKIQSSTTSSSAKPFNVDFAQDVRYAKACVCAYCDDYYSDMNELLAHYSDAHDESFNDLLHRSRSKMGRKQLERKERYEALGKVAVEYKGRFYDAPDMKEHQENYTVCLLCYYKFRNEEYVPHVILQHYYYRIHNLKRQTDEPLEQPPSKRPRGAHCCEECGVVFELYEAFCAHMWETHRNEEYRSKALPPLKTHHKRVTCEQCGKDFKNKHTLACHNSEFHSGVDRASYRRSKQAADSIQRVQQRFACELCTYTTPEQRRLRAHINKTHLGIHMYKCPFCAYTTSEQTALRHHKYTHSSVKPLSCNYCTFKCVQKHDIRSHLKRNHDVTVEAVRGFKSYHSDPEVARRMRNAAIEETKRHFTQTKDESLHSVRGSEFYADVGKDGDVALATTQQNTSGVSVDYEVAADQTAQEKLVMALPHDQTTSLQQGYVLGGSDTDAGQNAGTEHSTVTPSAGDAISVTQAALPANDAMYQLGNLIQLADGRYLLKEGEIQFAKPEPNYQLPTQQQQQQTQQQHVNHQQQMGLSAFNMEDRVAAHTLEHSSGVAVAGDASANQAIAQQAVGDSHYVVAEELTSSNVVQYDVLNDVNTTYAPHEYLIECGEDEAGNKRYALVIPEATASSTAAHVLSDNGEQQTNSNDLALQPESILATAAITVKNEPIKLEDVSGGAGQLNTL